MGTLRRDVLKKVRAFGIIFEIMIIIYDEILKKILAGEAMFEDINDE